MSKQIHTLKGPVDPNSLGLILPHEHLFTDLRGPSVADYAQRDADSVIKVVAPFLADAAATGVTALVECSTVGVGRNLSILRRLSDTTPIYIVAPTGVYRDAFTPEDMRHAGVDELTELWTRELTEGIEGTSMRAGFIKLAMSDDGPTPLEIRNLKAAVRASQQTGAVIASHTIGGRVARQEMDIIESAGLDLRRFVWIHAQTEPDLSVMKEAARRGAYVELDSVGAPYQSQPALLDQVVGLVEAGFIRNILLSHDAGWFDPSRPDGLPEGGYRGYTALVKDFVPAMLERGLSEEDVRCITVTNPREALAFPA
jgi:phosphotriesterase-related protein